VSISSPDRVAIVSVGAVLPGAGDLAEFWSAVLGARSAARQPPPGRWAADPASLFAPGGPRPDRVYSTRACFLDDAQLDPRLLDPFGLRIARATFEQLDPLFTLLALAGAQAWRGAVTAPLDRSRVGVIVGNIALPTQQSSLLTEHAFAAEIARQLGLADRAPAPVHPANTRVVALPAALLASALGIAGPILSLDAACASSLYAIKLAVDELLAHRVDAMIAGGASRPDSLYTQMGFAQLRALSPSGRCAPFSDAADGLVVGEGAGLFVLKRLGDALAHGDEIHAVIAGCGLSNDIAGNLMSPASEGQLRAMQAAYRAANLRPSDIDLVECHGTGTPIGDAVELRSLHQLWQSQATVARPPCIIGSVKSNVGHLLTGAGGAGLAKVLLALRHKMLPPTANFSNPAAELAAASSPFRVLAQPQPWPAPASGAPRRAAISGFGFGGINAHVIVEEWNAEEWNAEEWDAERSPANLRRRQNATHEAVAPAAVAGMSAGDAQPIAIVGLAAHFGPWRNAASLAQRLFADVEPGEIVADRAGGYYVGPLEVPLAAYRIPPAELAEMLPQQLLMLEVARAAMSDARQHPDIAADRTDLGVFLGIGLDLNATNFHARWSIDGHARRWADLLGTPATGPAFEAWAEKLRDAASAPLTANRTMGNLGGIVASRVARYLRAGGPSFVVAAEENSGLRAVEAAARALARGEIRIALAGAVDLSGDARAVASRVDPQFPVGEGAAALVLKRLADAEADGDPIYAVLESFATSSAVEREERRQNDRAASVGLVVQMHAAPAIEDLSSAAAMDWSRIAPGTGQPAVAAASPALRVGAPGAASGLLALLTAAMALDRQLLPIDPESPGELRSGSQLAPRRFTPRAAQHWLHNRSAGPRRALVSSTAADSQRTEATLREAAAAPRAIGPRAIGPRTLPAADLESVFLLCAASPGELQTELDRLEAHLAALSSAGSDGLARFAAKCVRTAATRCDSSNRAEPAIALVLREPSQIPGVFAQARAAVAAGRPLRSDAIWYSPRPLRSSGNVAFVYPGAGNQFLGMGRDLAAAWPAVMRRLDAENLNLAEQFAAGRYWTATDPGEITERDVAFGQVWLGALVTDVLAQFNVRPNATIGYSLGESAALFATRAWTARDEMLARMNASPLFISDLAGPCDAARRLWKLPAGEAVEWRIGLVDRTADQVRAALAKHDRAYLLIVNTPSQCVIGGQRAAVEQVVRDLRCAWHPIHGATTVHCEVARSVAEAYRALHMLPTAAPAEIRFYSGAWQCAYDVTRESAADSIVAQAVAPFDFSKLIEQAYADGVRVFLEVGPGASCTRMIGEILGDRDHVALPLCVARQSSQALLVRTLAALAAEGFDVDLAPLYADLDGGQTAAPSASGRTMTILAGRPPWVAPPPPVAASRAAAVESVVDPVVEHPFMAVPAPRFPNHALQAMSDDSSLSPSVPFAPAAMLDQVVQTEQAKAASQARYLQLASRGLAAVGKARQWQAALLTGARLSESDPPLDNEQPALDRDQCLEFAIGSIARVLGPQFAEVDRYPTRVRLPDEPLMLVDRILSIEGEACSLGSGRVVTEHDIHRGAWYLDGGRIPTCIAVEAGQADLFLSGYLGIDLVTQGRAVYRLLDAVVTFHRPLPVAGQTIHYDIRIERFFRQGDTHLFRFRFDATVDGEPLLTMRDGCAGFFTAEALAAGQGVVQTTIDRQPRAGQRTGGWRALAPFGDGGDAGRVESYDDAQLAALRRGDLASCFGSAFANLPLARPATLPSGRMQLVDRILKFDPAAGRYGLGQIVGEADIADDAWFLTCHFVDDQVMPGTLMYECCLHTLRVFLLRAGWVAEQSEVVYEPIPGVASQLKCRGQVTAATRRVQYELTIKEIGYAADETPYVLADALTYADGKPVVQMNNMSLQLSGATRLGMEALWAKQSPRMAGADSNLAPRRAPLFDYDRILAFAIGDPSQAFGKPYAIFDRDRVIARLPGPPYQFLDRIVLIEGCRPFELAAGGVIEAEYDVPADAWYFAANRQVEMPFAVLLEIALQPCGWLAAYLGSALASDVDLSFRNLGGKAVQRRAVTATSGTLMTQVKITRVSKSGGMIIQNFDFAVRDSQGEVYRGDTYFGFFSKAALANQVGIRDAAIFHPPSGVPGASFPMADASPLPEAALRMVQRVDYFDQAGGPHGLGFVRGSTPVDPQAWFFQAHFKQDPVWPGSLGLESFIQLLKVAALRRWVGEAASLPATAVEFETIAHDQPHAWTYRGQILPTDRQVAVQAVITRVDDAARTLWADGHLWVDGRLIYQMDGFALRIREEPS
jgi:acyl transferase domain-containing protein/3-hydroxymyristoyl/3-hydroxydecanoyl-(acyl carrier protein) dehydratase